MPQNPLRLRRPTTLLAKDKVCFQANGLVSEVDSHSMKSVSGGKKLPESKKKKIIHQVNLHVRFVLDFLL